MDQKPALIHAKWLKIGLPNWIKFHLPKTLIGSPPPSFALADLLTIAVAFN